MPSSMTPGVFRSLEKAAKLAHAAGHSVVEPVHLLWAMLLDESQAAEILTLHGISQSTLRKEFPEFQNLDMLEEEIALESSSVSLAEPTDSPSAIVPQGPAVQAILQEAKLCAASLPENVEVASEHLLLGLLKVDSEIATRLKSHGLNPMHCLSTHPSPQSEPSPSLPVDFEIEWNTSHGSRSENVSAGTNKNQSHSNRDTVPISSNLISGNETLLRILDAAANRAREGLRVLEDYTRFYRDDHQQTNQLKEMRHAISEAMSQIEPQRLLSARDTEADVGTEITTPAEATRETTSDLVTANCKRAQEALRSLEEYGKLLKPELGSAFKSLRYRIYTMEKQLLTGQSLREWLQDCRLYLLVTQSTCKHSVETVIRRSLESGVDIIQIREKNLPDRELMAYLRQVREWTSAAGKLFIVNDRPDLAVLCDADGVHVGQEELSVADARAIVGPNRLVGVSTHSLEQAKRGVHEGADYLGVGPVFPSQTKQFEEFAGLEFVREVANSSSGILIPWFAIGGIDADNLEQVVKAGANRVAVSSCICRSDEPARQSRFLCEQLPEKASRMESS
ncbi:MAG: hypothetical protein Tsb009_35210 [Planctomycetaceae bacterium]